MDKYSVVIDSETISYWKFLLISKVYDEQKIDCFYILNKSKTLCDSLLRDLLVKDCL